MIKITYSNKFKQHKTLNWKIGHIIELEFWDSNEMLLYNMT